MPSFYESRFICIFLRRELPDLEDQIFSFIYDANGNPLSRRFPNGEMERYRYDANNQRIRMDEYNKDGVQKIYTEYTYDENGNRTSDKNRVPTTPVKNWEETSNTGTWGGEWNVYTYDACNRLILELEKDTSLTITYGYDYLGNKTLEKDSRDDLRYTYNELNQLEIKTVYNHTMNYNAEKVFNMIEENDWRLRGQEDYFKNKKFKLKKFKMAGRNSMHMHCEFCWHKFMEDADGIKDCSDEGYCSLQGDHWICKECFEDFRDEFNFTLVDS